MALPIQKDRMVTVTYRLLDGDGRLLEEKTPEQPYEYLHGHGFINDALERAIEGKNSGLPGRSSSDARKRVMASMIRR